MRLLYLSLSYLPSRRASTVQVMKMCAALARRNHEVHLVAKRGKASVADDHAYYCVDPSFRITKLWRPTRRGGGLIYAAGMCWMLAKDRQAIDIAYCRDPLGAALAAELRVPFVFEVHGIPDKKSSRALLARTLAAKSVVGIVAISDMLRRDLYDAEIAPRDRTIVVAHDASDLPTASVAIRDRPRVIGYVGGLYPGRGIDVIVALARRLPHVQFRVIGGGESDVKEWSRTTNLTNVWWMGFRSQSELPSLYSEMDILLMPYAKHGVLGPTGSTDTMRWASPMKMFEYMAAGVPIISSDLPVLREVLRDGENALLVPPGDIDRWQTAIVRLLENPELRYQLATTAQTELAHRYTWDARADLVLRGLGLD